MTSPARTPFMTKILAIGLVILTVLPLIIFATDLPNRMFMRNARQRAVVAGVRTSGADENREVRRQRVRQQRSKIHVNPLGIAYAIVFQLAMLAVIAAVGLRLFSLRL